MKEYGREDFDRFNYVFTTPVETFTSEQGEPKEVQVHPQRPNKYRPRKFIELLWRLVKGYEDGYSDTKSDDPLSATRQPFWASSECMSLCY